MSEIGGDSVGARAGSDCRNAASWTDRPAISPTAPSRPAERVSGLPECTLRTSIAAVGLESTALAARTKVPRYDAFRLDEKVGQRLKQEALEGRQEQAELDRCRRRRR